MFIRKLLIRTLVQYGILSAQQPSYHGAFETKVPASLSKRIAK